MNVFCQNASLVAGKVRICLVLGMVLTVFPGTQDQLSADVIAPNANASVDTPGTESNRFPLLVNGGMRYQQVYNASEFGSLAPGGEFIIGFVLRPDNEFGGAFSQTINNLTISLSTTSAAADGLSTSFADNIGSNVTTVLNGSVTISSADVPGPGNTRAFDVNIAFDTPFFYDPSMGNLLLDILNADPNNNNINLFFDAANVTGDPISRVFSDEGDPFAATGTDDTHGLITKFTTAIPEPGSMVVLGLGSLCLCFRRRR